MGGGEEGAYEIGHGAACHPGSFHARPPGADRVQAGPRKGPQPDRIPFGQSTSSAPHEIASRCQTECEK